MTVNRILIEDEIFDRFPSFYRGLVLVDGLENRASYKPARRDLKNAIASASELEDGDPRLTSWMDAHRTFGSDPETYPPSILALVRRVRKEPNLPFINTAVALFNTISLRHCLPCGGDDADAIVDTARVRFAKGAESFVGLGGDAESAPQPGEVIYADDDEKVMCRRWNWRNAEHSKIGIESQRLIINVDGLAPLTPETVEAARDELAALLEKHCSAKIRTDALHRDRRELSLR